MIIPPKMLQFLIMKRKQFHKCRNSNKNCSVTFQALDNIGQIFLMIFYMFKHIHHIKDGEYERIATRRMNRKGEPIIRSFFARQFYRIINKISNVKIVDGARDFSMMSRKMVNSVLSLKERSRFTKGIFEWPGYKTKWISFSNHERHAGNTKWSFWKLFAYSIEGIVSFSNYPLIISSVVGVAFCVLSILMILVVIIRKLIWGDKVDGWPSLVCIILFVSGIQQMSIGIIGSYLSRVFTEVKNRPLYVVLDTNISSDKPNEAEAIK